MSYFHSGFMAAARVLAAKDWSHPRVLAAIRKAAHAGARIDEIHAEFWPDVTVACTRQRLKRFNIKPALKMKRVSRGELTSLSINQQRNLHHIFKARIIGEASSL